MSKAVYFLLLLSSMIMSCRSTQLTTGTPKNRSVNFLLRQLEKNHIDYTWFGANAKIKVDSEQEKASFAASIRMQKDSLIWIKIRKMNIEGARIKITPETIEILDRQNGLYTKKPFSFLKNEYGLEVSFAQLQALIIGNPILWDSQSLVSVLRKQQNVLQTPKAQKTVLKIFMDPNSFLINSVQGSMHQNALSIDYSAYETVEQEQIPTKKAIEIDSEETGWLGLNISFSKISLNEVQKVGFRVPDNYERK
ncbi:MAG: Unknown protein [uncultured Aureispira sp.]|uniref:DUF4292 domain-containing protein n=1 Tax=uncultured Aureispira sp. TaxID=1331704 RepID=A0A6S6RUL2_9BACT|nr:MAG: Unknown protein [uncultured Aureispira sp.]